jgi:biotin carboxyl carrier protein
MINKLKVRIESHWYLVEVGDLEGDEVEVIVDGQRFEVNLDKDVKLESISSSPVLSNTKDKSLTKDNSNPRGSFKTPMPGSVIDILVKEGDEVSDSQDICIIESMKMQQTLKADFVGTITEILISSGDQVLDGDELFKYS